MHIVRRQIIHCVRELVAVMTVLLARQPLANVTAANHVGGGDNGAGYTVLQPPSMYSCKPRTMCVQGDVAKGHSGTLAIMATSVLTNLCSVPLTGWFGQVVIDVAPVPAHALLFPPRPTPPHS